MIPSLARSFLGSNVFEKSFTALQVFANFPCHLEVEIHSIFGSHVCLQGLFNFLLEYLELIASRGTKKPCPV